MSADGSPRGGSAVTEACGCWRPGRTADGVARSDLAVNFSLGLLHGVFYRAGLAFSEPTSVLPVFLSHFTGSLPLIGVFSALIQGGGLLPQLFVAHRIEGLPRKKPVLLAAIWVRAVAWGILGLLTFFWGGGNPTVILVALLVLLFVFSFAGGVGSVPFNAIWGKALPPTLRGRFFGHRQLWGGLLALGAAYVVKRVLEDPDLEFPNDYGLLFLLSFVFLVLSYLALSFLREPPEPAAPPRRGFREFMRHAVGLIRHDRDLGRVLVSRATIGFGSFALPFYALFGKHELAMPDAGVGVLIGASVVGSIGSNLIWAELSDRRGNRAVIRWTAALSAAIPLAALAATYTGRASLLVLVFALIGSTVSGSGVGFMNYVLELAPARLRPAYIAITGTVASTSFLWPIAGGGVVGALGYRATFAIALIVVSLGYVCSMTLSCVRDRTAGDAP